MSEVTTRQIGRSLPRVEARAKVTGTAEYIHNLRLPGMLFGKIDRSTMPHGRIRRIDTAAAAATARRDAHRHRRGHPRPSSRARITARRFTISRSWRSEKVRFAGEPVAVVLAADPHMAETAAQMIVDRI